MVYCSNYPTYCDDMAIASQLSSLAAAFTLLAMVSVSTANAPLVIIWLALARKVECENNARHDCVLGLEDSPHGNLGREISDRQANAIKNRERAMVQLQSHGPKAFLRRFKVTRPMFDDLVEKIRSKVEPGAYGKEQARRSSGSYVKAELQLAASLRWLSGANHLCQQDNFGISQTEFYGCLWEVVWALDAVIPAPNFDIRNEGQMRALADGMFVRSCRTMPGCIGALDGMAVRITRPTLKDTVSPQSFLNRKGFYSVNLQAIADCNRKILWWNIKTVGSTHDSMAWSVTPLAQDLALIGLPFGLWIAGDDAYASSEYLISPYSIKAGRVDNYKDNFNFYQSRCRINIECAFGILVEKFGVLRRAQSGTLKHITKVVAVCIKLHNLGIDKGLYRIMPMGRDVRLHESLLPVQQHMVSLKPKHLKNRVKSTLRDELCDVLKTQGSARPVANRKRLRSA